MGHSIKVGIVSDTHGFLDQRVASVVQKCDYAIHAGDICDPEVLNRLNPAKSVLAVRGNNDFGDILGALPGQESLDLPGGRVIVEHGHRLGNHPDHDELRWHHAEARLIVYGHTHKRVIDDKSEPWVVNPGAAGKERTKGGPSCLVLHANKTSWHIETFLFSDTETG